MTAVPFRGVVVGPHFLAPANYPEAEVGTKAAGIQKLPAAWVPSFIVLTAGFGRQLSERPGWFGRLQETGPSYVRAAFADLLRAPRLLVRSSACGESIADRGALVTLESPPMPSAIERTVDRAWRYNFETLDNERRDDASLALMIQVRVQSRRYGHMSNERRVSERHDSFLVEEFGLSDELLTSYRITTATPADRGPLLAGGADDLRALLRGLAAQKLGLRGRRHYEWVWDGNRLWVVQCDFESTPVGDPPNSRWTAPIGAAVPPLTVFKEDTQAQKPWNKVNCVAAIRNAGLPAATLFVLEDSSVIESLAEYGAAPPDLAADVQSLSSSPVVVRTDLLKPPEDLATVLLPRTETCLDAASVMAFLIERARYFLERGFSCDEFAFLVHRFIPARAGSYSVARPGDARVRIDSSWGVPDTLLYYPHDSYQVDAGTGSIHRQIRCKSEYIDFDCDGKWREKLAGTQWDWKQSVVDDDLRVIARDVLAIAESVGNRVEVMHFVDVHDASAPYPRCLPWFFRLSPEEAGGVPSGSLFRAGSFVVRDQADIQVARRRLEADQAPPVRRIRFRASAEATHSPDLVDEVCSLALDHSLSVELEGSELAHVVYILRRKSVPVRVARYDRPGGPRDVHVFAKLVRDQVPAIIAARGEEVVTERSPADRLLSLLTKKAVEEAFELYDATDLRQLIEESADLIEVLKSLCAVVGVEWTDVMARAEAKRQERGSFDQGIVLVGTYIDDSPDDDDAVLFSQRRLPSPLAGTRDRELLIEKRESMGQPLLRLTVPSTPPDLPGARVISLASLGMEAYLVVTRRTHQTVVEMRPGVAPDPENQRSLFPDEYQSSG